MKLTEQPAKVSGMDLNLLLIAWRTGQRVPVFAKLVDSENAVVVAEIEQGDQFLPLAVSADPEHAVVFGIHNPNIRLAVEDPMRGAKLFQSP